VSELFRIGENEYTIKEFEKIIKQYNIFRNKNKLSKLEKFRRAKIKTKDYREWINTCKENDRSTGVLYLVQIYDETESFLKVGITTTSLERRFRELPYDFKAIVTKEFSDVTELYLTEKWIHYRFNRARYTPIKNFVGYTECYKTNLEKKLYKEVNG
jgi:hypothetical protein